MHDAALAKPNDILALMEEGAREALQTLLDDAEVAPPIQILFSGDIAPTLIREVTAADMNKLVLVPGISEHALQCHMTRGCRALTPVLLQSSTRRARGPAPATSSFVARTAATSRRCGYRPALAASSCRARAAQGEPCSELARSPPPLCTSLSDRISWAGKPARRTAARPPWQTALTVL